MKDVKMRRHAELEKPDPTPIARWRIFRSWGSSKAFIGIVTAVNQKSAIKKAIAQFEITDPEHQRRLVAEIRH